MTFLINFSSKLFILSVSIPSKETPCSQIFYIWKAITSKSGINTVTYDRAKIWNQFYFDFIFRELSQTKSKLKHY